MYDDSDQVLTHTHHVNLDDMCSNLRAAWIYTAAYFEAGALNCASVGELVQAVSKAHAYLDAHMAMLVLFKLIDSFYGLTLHSQIYHVTRRIPAAQRVRAWKGWELTSFKRSRNVYDFCKTLCILGDSGYAPDDDSSVGEANLHPFCLTVVPPPIKPVATPSLSKSGDVAGPSTSSQKVPKPKMICTPQAPKEPTFASPTKKPVAVVLPSQSANSMSFSFVLIAPTRKASKVPPANPAAPKPIVQTRAASKKAPAVRKPVLADPSSDSDAGSEDKDEEGMGEAPEEEDWLSDEIKAPPVKKPRLEPAAGITPPPPHAYHPRTGVPLTGLLYFSSSAPTVPVLPLPLTDPSTTAKGKGKAAEPSSPASPSPCGQVTRNKKSPPCSSKDRRKAKKSLIPSGSRVVASATPASSLLADNVDKTIYVRAFHPQVDLQFHEPPSRQALEAMKLSMLPSAPNSLTKAPTQMRNGREYVYRCHSDIDPHFIHPPLLTWPCYNCTLSGYPDECEFEGGVGEEVCTKCKTGRHGPCSTRWDANQLRHAASLLDPLTLSSDGAIRHGVDGVEHINAEIALLGRAKHCLHKDHKKIVGELADGLNAIASREHGTEIIDAYAQVSDFLKSFVVCLGEDAGDSGAEGGASDSGDA
ncbi:hypothetical protein EDD85DRAFT_951604 [Armillaria nabsnona]|nr:hypothetical protein EDD85DRAFT_951604 [Armillaria nabsnona]